MAGHGTVTDHRPDSRNPSFAVSSAVEPVPGGLRIAHLLHSLTRESAGLQSAVLGLTTALHERGDDAAAFGLGDRREDPDAHLWPAGAHRGQRKLGPYALGLPRELGPALHRFAPQVLHQHGLWNAQSWIAMPWGRSNGARRVVSPQGMLQPWALAQKALKKQLFLKLVEHRNLATAGCLHAVSESELEALGKLAPGVPACLIPNGVDVPHHSELREPSLPETGGGVPDGDAVDSDSRTSSDGAPCLLFLGRIHTKKNVLGLVDAWAAIEDSLPDTPWRLVIAGWGDADAVNELQSRIASHRVRRCRYVGPVFGDDKSRLLRDADAFVLPSSSEGQPLAALEAMAWGVPALLSSQCNLREAFSAGAAWRIETDAAGIELGLRRLFSLRREERMEAGTRARSLVLDRFSWESVALRFARVYTWLVDPAGATRPLDVM